MAPTGGFNFVMAGNLQKSFVGKDHFDPLPKQGIQLFRFGHA